MAEQAQITSVDAIVAFRARLILYASKARAAAEEASTEVYRTHQWLQGEQRRFWEEQVRIRRKKLERAEGELSSSRMSTFQSANSMQAAQVRKARESLREAESKLAMLKKWDRELDNRAEPILRQINPLQHALSNEVPKAIAHLGEIIRILDEYAGVAVPRSLSTGSRETSSGLTEVNPTSDEENSEAAS